MRGDCAFTVDQQAGQRGIIGCLVNADRCGFPERMLAGFFNDLDRFECCWDQFNCAPVKFQAAFYLNPVSQLDMDLVHPAGHIYLQSAGFIFNIKLGAGCAGIQAVCIHRCDTLNDDRFTKMLFGCLDRDTPPADLGAHRTAQRSPIENYHSGLNNYAG